MASLRKAYNTMVLFKRSQGNSWEFKGTLDNTKQIKVGLFWLKGG